jgi:Helix-turn-helix domain
MDWALEFAPPMPSQLVATLSGLARHADKQGSGAYPSVPRLAAYACKSERSVQRDLADLRKLGLIRLGDQSKANHLPEGKRPEVYDLATERTVPDGRAGRDEVTLTSRVTLASSRRRGGKKKPSSDGFPEPGTGDVDVRGDVDVTGDADVADGVTPTSGRGDVHVTQTKQMNQPTEPKDKDSSAPSATEGADEDLFGPLAAKSEAIHKQRETEDLTAFGDFWILYPKKRSRGEALKAWKAAVAAGTDPEHITEAARQYAKERAGQDPQYTKYPATWLNKGCYDDEPDPEPGQLRAVGGYQPFQPPPPDAYANDLGF